MTIYFIIYKTTNHINNKFYIGAHQTKNINDKYIGSGYLLKRAIEKHGLENFSKEILHYCNTKEEMFFKEAEILTTEFLLQNKDMCYNLCPGGFGGNSLQRNAGYQRFIEQHKLNGTWKAYCLAKAKIFKGKPSKNKGMKRTKEFCKYMSLIKMGNQVRKGAVIPEEMKIRISTKLSAGAIEFEGTTYTSLTNAYIITGRSLTYIKNRCNWLSCDNPTLHNKPSKNSKGSIMFEDVIYTSLERAHQVTGRSYSYIKKRCDELNKPPTA